MRQATLRRTQTSDEGTFGVIVTDTGFTCFSGELPQRENASHLSCIPAGTYSCTYRNSPKHGMCYHVENVPGRDNIEIHSANWVGDVTLGYKCQLEGCIAPGLEVNELEGQTAVRASKAALYELETDLNKEAFELTIVDDCGAGAACTRK
jgi:hypothetical protein